MELSPLERGNRIAVGAVNIAHFLVERARGGAFAQLAESSDGLRGELQQASLQFHSSGLPTITAEHEGGLPQLTEAHRRVA